MDQIDDALHTVTYWLRLGLEVMLRMFVILEAAAHAGLSQIGIPDRVQTVVLLVVDVLLAVLVVRLFGGLIRVILILFLILLVLHLIGVVI